MLPETVPTATDAVLLRQLSHRYGKTQALRAVDLALPAGATIALIGPDGVGKSTLLSLVAGIKIIQSGQVQVLGGDMADKKTRQALSHRIAFMPQGLGHNLYPTLSINENVDFHARLFGLNAAERQARIARLLQATGLAPFAERAAGKLSGGMKQKLSLCCALVHNPQLLILDEPTTGVDPLSRRQFWALVADLRAENPAMTVLVATAYIDEAEGFDYVVAMDDGHLLAAAPTAQLLADSGCNTLEAAYIQLLPEHKRGNAEGLALTPFVADPTSPPAMEAEHLTKRFGDFTAVDNVSFVIEKGEIFGFLGSNGCGKSTTMKMLTGLLEPSEGSARLLGHPTDANDMATRMRVGYMSQAFSLYEELSVRRNLYLHAKLYQMPTDQARAAVNDALQQFELAEVADAKPAALSLGIRQRLQLAAACLHRPEVLILDEPTSGVDPAARDMFWQYLLTLSRRDKITLFVSTHFMNEAARCDRISLMHQGRVLDVGTPQALCARQHTDSLEEAFIAYLQQAESENPDNSHPAADTAHDDASGSLETAASKSNISGSLADGKHTPQSGLSGWLATVWTFAVREGRELLRDPVRLFFALFGPVLLMMAAAVSVSFDVKDVRFAVLDHDNTSLSRELTTYFEGSPYFKATPPLHNEADIDRVLRGSQARLVVEIPAGFGRDMLRGEKPEVGFYIDGAMPFTGENIRAFVQGIMADYGRNRLQAAGYSLDGAVAVEPRFIYNPDFKSIFAITPGMIMMAMMLIPVMMTALGVVREKEIGSITNLYTSPASVTQFLVGKQLPYVALSMGSYLLLVWLAVVVLAVPVKGSFWAMSVGALALIFAATAFGLLISSFVRSQVAAIFGSSIAAMIPAMNFSGLLYPVSTLEGANYWLAWGFPSAWFQLISLGGFTKGLGWAAFAPIYPVLLLFTLAYVALASVLLKKQER